MAKKIDINGLDHFKEKENAMIASEYSSSKTYAVGDYVYYAGTLYCCTTAITTAEAWTSGHWTAAKLADDCSSLKTAIANNPFITKEYAVAANQGQSASNDKIPVNIKQGETFKINIVQTATRPYRMYYWYSNNTSTNTSWISAENRTLTVTASKDIIAISIHVPSDTTASTYIVTVIQTIYGLSLENLLTDTVPSIQNEVNIINNNESVEPFPAVIFNYTEGTAHSSSSDVLKTNIKSGSNFIVSINATSQISANLYVQKTDGTNVALFSQFNSFTTYSHIFTAEFDIVAVKLYIAEPSSSGTCYIVVAQDIGYEMLKNNTADRGYMLDAALNRKLIYPQYKLSVKYGQAFCSYNGKFYSTDGDNICEQDSSGTVLRDVALSVGHGNSMQLSKANNGTVYISGLYDSTIYVVDLTTLTITDTITLPYTGLTNAVVDDIANIAYVFQRGSTSDTYYTFYKYDIANEQTVEQKPFYNGRSMQGLDLYNDTILMSHGMGTNADPSGYKAFTIDGVMVGEYVVNDIIHTEPQGICIDRETLHIYVSTTAKRLYEII